jgi:HEAT repeat protein
MARMSRLYAATALLAFAAWYPVLATETNDVLSQLDRMVSLGEKADRSLGESIADGIATNPAAVSKALVLKLNNKDLTDAQLAVYVWALGLTKDQTATSVIEGLYKQNKTELVRSNCLRALAAIGGQRAGAFLLATLDLTMDKEKRFDILNLLSQMQCEAALPRTEEVLQQDPKEYYWQSVFVFGKMGDKSVPFLLKRINNKERNIRGNAMSVLGQWLIAPEAAKPLQDQYWAEKDAELRGLILSSLEKTIADFSQMKTFFEQVVAKEKDAKAADFARETVSTMDRMKADVADYGKKKQPSAAAFQREYELLFKSAGKSGSYDVLGVSSTAQDEPKLKALRERILQRNSDEAFYDYQKVNEIVLRNRLLGRMKDDKKAAP